MFFFFLVSYFRVGFRRGLNFYQAKTVCARRGARLAIIRNGRQNAAVLRTLRGFPRGRVLWIGGSDRRREGRWLWENRGRPFPMRFRWVAALECSSSSRIFIYIIRYYYIIRYTIDLKDAVSFFQLLGSWRTQQLGQPRLRCCQLR